MRKGLAVVAFVFLSYCAVQVRDGMLSRPHPIVWRVVHGVGIIYMCFLTFFLIQNPTDGRAFLKVFDPTLGK